MILSFSSPTTTIEISALPMITSAVSMLKNVLLLVLLIGLIIPYCSGSSLSPSLSSSSSLTFYKGKCCLFSSRVHLVLLELGLDFNIVDIDTANKPEWFQNINPRGKVPALGDENDFVVYESGICNEYLIDRATTAITTTTTTTTTTTLNPQHLLPIGQPNLRAKIRLACDHWDTRVKPSLFQFQYNVDDTVQEQKRAAMEQALETLEEMIRNDAGPYLCGDQFTLADCHVLPFLHRFLLVTTKKDDNGAHQNTLLQYELPRDKFPKIWAWYETCRERDSVVNSLLSLDEELLDHFRFRLEQEKTRFFGTKSD